LTPADNEDIQLEVKFDSALTENNQDMGILVQEDEDKLLRLDFFYDGTKTHIFGAAVESSSTTNMFNIEIANGSPAPLYMLVKRDGNEWTVSYKYANDTWVKAKTFTHNMTVNEVGLYVANPGTAPAFKGQFDYFFNAVNPIIPQDQNKNTISVSTVGEGTVEYDKKDNYVCGEKVTFEAIPAEGWNFGGWGGGALSDYSNPDTLTVSGSHEVIAKFTTGSGGISIYMPAVIKP
jgi:hypothetical protein